MGRNILWNSIGTLFYFACQWLLTVLVVRLNGNYSDAGVLSLAMSIATPLSTVAMLNLRTFQVANIDERFSDGDFIYTRAITCLISFAACWGMVLAGKYSFYSAICVLLFMLYRLSESGVDVLHGIDQRAWRLDIVGKSFLMRGCFTLTGFVVGEYWFRSLPISILLMGIGVYGVILGYDIPLCKKNTKLNLQLKKENFIALVKIGVPLGAFAFLISLLSSIPRVFLEMWHGEDALGVLGSITTITVLVPQLASFIFNPLVPIFAERWKTNDRTGFNKLFIVCCAATALIGSAVLVGGWLLGEWGLCLIFGVSIRPYSDLLCPVIGTAIITAYIWLFGSILTVFGEYQALARMSLIATIGCLFASMCFIKGNAYVGTIAATFVGLGIECLLLGRKMIRVMIKKK